ncbi:MAG: alkaline phosphatase family protein [Lentisphaerae bacterium]|nr:alkaline phosphatase family protein [Lentisphaerota bacterium]
MNKKVIMIMVDGFGIPENGWFNSIYSEFCSSRFVKLLSDFSIPVTTGMDVDGIPQSATGQTALFTGFNAAQIMGMHMQGFPGPKLREVICSRNLFSNLLEKGKKVAFANAYIQFTLEELDKMRLKSVTTTMVESSIGWVRNMEDLLSGKAVYHDLTRKTIMDNLSIREISPKQAAMDLLNISKEHDFTLFEYFLTDRAGHKPDRSVLKEVLGNLSSFVCHLIDEAAENTPIILTGDHGNCEDITTKRHTKNPVPLFIYNHPLPSNRELMSIEQIYSYILEDIFINTKQGVS